jgi:hypothetical protein
MKITKGYVAVKPDGTFLRFGVSNRWGKEIPWFEEVKSIEDATVLSHPTYFVAIGSRAKIEGLPELKYVPVEVRREVVQTGWGVE